ncbi:hypothetical protein HAPAU_25790 [Halalkalicoccus paucihalophilus]|uniref:Uncharacterized protein n=1 Tax=Halalkalicoccus paucihalophilus TaxID=1008153 RepID=A0A151AE17_9EURY|nr:hypothetical protein HAPAU_25790 [Halalkalicoccus paucihalophilus]
MSDEYVTPATNLPPDPEGDEITLQISDKYIAPRVTFD